MAPQEFQREIVGSQMFGWLNFCGAVWKGMEMAFNDMESLPLFRFTHASVESLVSWTFSHSYSRNLSFRRIWESSMTSILFYTWWISFYIKIPRKNCLGCAFIKHLSCNSFFNYLTDSISDPHFELCESANFLGVSIYTSELIQNKMPKTT